MTPTRSSSNPTHALEGPPTSSRGILFQRLIAQGVDERDLRQLLDREAALAVASNVSIKRVGRDTVATIRAEVLAPFDPARAVEAELVPIQLGAR